MNTTTTTSSTTLPGELRVKRSTSRLAIAATAFLAILRRDIVVTGREFIVFLIQVLLQPLFFLFIFGKVLHDQALLPSYYQESSRSLW